MVFSGVQGAPAPSFPSPPYTVLPTTPVSREKPYLYVDAGGNYQVFVPSLRTNAVRRELDGRQQHAGHLDPAEPVLRRQARATPRPRSTRRWPRA